MSFERKIRWISSSFDPRTLADLKSRFKNDINSRRKYSEVKSFFDLVGILLTRGIISHEDKSVLNLICQKYFGINFSEVPDSLNSARSSLSQRNHQLSLSTAHVAQLPGLTNENLEAGGISAEKDLKVLPPEVVNIIVLGNITEKQWRPFARALQVDTGSISQEASIAEKIQKALSTFMQNTEHHQQWSLLEVALERIRRIDLRDHCLTILSSQK